MKAREIARIAVAAGWGAGLALILAGEPVAAAAGAPVLAMAGVLTLQRWGGHLRARAVALQVRLTAKLRCQMRRGRALERA